MLSMLSSYVLVAGSKGTKDPPPLLLVYTVYGIHAVICGLSGGPAQALIPFKRAFPSDVGDTRILRYRAAARIFLPSRLITDLSPPSVTVRTYRKGIRLYSSRRYGYRLYIPFL